MKQYQVQLANTNTKILFDSKAEADLFLKFHNKDKSLKLDEVEISDTYYNQRNLVNNQIQNYFNSL